VVDKDLLKEATINDLPYDWRFIAEICGIEKAIEIIANFNGNTLYTPAKTVITNIRNRYIAGNLNKSSVKKLARKFNITPRAIYKIIRKKKMHENPL
jgi:Mor family transcriptional regulator